MPKASAHFAVAQSSDYRVMFGGFIESAANGENLAGEAKGAFQVLIYTLVDQQNSGLIRRDDQRRWCDSSGHSSTVSRCWPLMDNYAGRERENNWSNMRCVLPFLL